MTTFFEIAINLECVLQKLLLSSALIVEFGWPSLLWDHVDIKETEAGALQVQLKPLRLQLTNQNAAKSTLFVSSERWLTGLSQCVDKVGCAFPSVNRNFSQVYLLKSISSAL